MSSPPRRSLDLRCEEISPVQVVEESREPSDHNLVVLPPLEKLLQQELTIVLPQRRHDLMNPCIHANGFGHTVEVHCALMTGTQYYGLFMGIPDSRCRW